LIYLWLGSTPTYCTCLKDCEECDSFIHTGDLFLMNWGPHHQQAFHIKDKTGRLLYRELNETLMRFRSSVEFHRTKFVFKMTTPTCEKKALKNNLMLYLSCILEPVKVSKSLVSEKLIAEKSLEKFDAAAIVILLSKAMLPSFSHRKTLKRNTPINEARPLYWDRLHPYCWVMTQLNRAMIATYFTSSHLHGITANLLSMKGDPSLIASPP
jgi:hypothetical protein